jgi:hypothetical protein
LTTRGDKIECEECGGSWIIDTYCQIKPLGKDTPAPDNLHAWVADHKTSVKNTIASTKDNFTLAQNSDVTLLRENHEGKFAPDADGTLTLNPSELTYTPTGATEPSFAFPVNSLDNYVIQQKDIFELTFEGTDYRFDMNGGSPMKWLMFVRYLNGFEEIEKSGVL